MMNHNSFINIILKSVFILYTKSIPKNVSNHLIVTLRYVIK